MALPTRPLGHSGLTISTVGFGAWATGGGDWAFGWGAQDDEQSVQAIRHAVELGVNWIDTAAVYGFGHSEEVVGLALHLLPERDRPMVFTKCGRVKRANAGPGDKPVSDLTPESIRSECDLSLRRLGIERIDLYQFHWPDNDTGTLVEDSWATMLELIDVGKVRAAGVSNFDVALLERITPSSLQPPFSLINRSAGAEVIPWCAAHDVGVIVYSPMQSGLLTDSFSLDRLAKMDEHDWRRNDPQFQGSALEKNLALRDALTPIAERHGVGTGAIAVAWTLAWPGVTGAIVGARSSKQVDGWIPAASLQLDDADRNEIAAALQRTGDEHPSSST